MKLKGTKKVSQAESFTNRPVTNFQKIERLKENNPVMSILIKKFNLESKPEF